MVSVIIPVYNVKQFVDEAIQSVINQTYKDIEIIVVDDGSTDGSGAICDSYLEKDARVKVYHKENGGLSDARNYGLDRATGEYVYFLDSDDWIVNYAIEVLVEEMERRDTDVLFFDAYCIDENDNEILKDVKGTRYRVGEYPYVCSGRQLFAEYMNKHEFNSAVQFSFIKRSAIKNKFVKILHEDELFTVQLLYSVEKAGHYSRILYARRFRSDSIMTSKKSARNFEGISVCIHELMKIEDRDLALERKLLDLYINALVVYQKLDRKERVKCKDSLKQLEADCKKCNIKSKLWYYRLPAWIMKDAVRAKNLYNAIGYYDRRIKDIQQKINATDSCVLLIGVPTHGNLGDHAIAQEAVKLLHEMYPGKQVVEIEKNLCDNKLDKVLKCIRNSDEVVIIGGGWMGNQWPRNERTIRTIVSNIKNCPITILPQTIYYEKKEAVEDNIRASEAIYGDAENVILFLRDRSSYEFAKEHKYANCHFTPDLVLNYSFEDPIFNRRGVLIVNRDDREKVIPDNTWDGIRDYLVNKNIPFYHTSTVVWPVSRAARENTINRKLKEFSSARVIITDRLHAMIFAAITGTPCIAFDNSSKKVSGVAEWILDLPYIKIAANDQDVFEFIDKFYYDNTTYNYIKPNFDAMKELMRNRGK